MSIRWREGWFPVKYGYCATEKDFRAAFKNTTDPDYEWVKSDGFCTKFEDKKGDTYIMVVVQVDWDKRPDVAMGVLVHECVHVVQYICEVIQDEAPSDEFMAYAVQAVFMEMLSDINNSRSRINNSKSGFTSEEEEAKVDSCKTRS